MTTINFSAEGFYVTLEDEQIVIKCGYKDDAQKFKLSYKEFGELLDLFRTYKMLTKYTTDTTKITQLYEYYKAMVRLREIKVAYTVPRSDCTIFYDKNPDRPAPYMDKMPQDLEFFMKIIVEVMVFTSLMDHAKSENL